MGGTNLYSLLENESIDRIDILGLKALDDISGFVAIGEVSSHEKAKFDAAVAKLEAARDAKGKKCYSFSRVLATESELRSALTKSNITILYAHGDVPQAQKGGGANGKGLKPGYSGSLNYPGDRTLILFGGEIRTDSVHPSTGVLRIYACYHKPNINNTSTITEVYMQIVAEIEALATDTSCCENPKKISYLVGPR